MAVTLPEVTVATSFVRASDMSYKLKYDLFSVYINSEVKQKDNMHERTVSRYHPQHDIQILKVIHILTGLSDGSKCYSLKC